MNPLKRLKFEHYVVAASVAALVLACLLIGPAATPKFTPGEETVEGQSRDVSKSGSKALLMLLQRMDVDVVRHERRLDLLSRDVRMVVSIAPKLALEPGEEESLISWIKKGGTFVLLAGKDGMGLRPFGLRSEYFHEATGTSDSTLDLSPLWPQLPAPYRLRTGNRKRIHREEETGIAWTSTAVDGTGWIAAAGRWGTGTVVVLCDGRAGRNEALIDGDHDALFVQLACVAAKDGAVAFDEYHHGHKEGQGPLTYVLDTAAGPAVFHVIAILFLVVMAAGKRLGRPAAVREGQRRRPMEFLEALARLFRASKNSGLALRLILADVTASLRTRFGAADKEALAAAAARRGFAPDRILKPLESAQRAARERPSAAELVHHAKALEGVRRLMTGTPNPTGRIRNS